MTIETLDHPALVPELLPAGSRVWVRQASDPGQRDQAMRLRALVFCEEQQIFTGSDRDAVDEHARLLVAGVQHDDGTPGPVLGTVRIHQAEAGVWWGSRLAVRREVRRQGVLGVSLIRLAVCSAHGLGCDRFLAHVQAQNVALFLRLHWRALESCPLHGRPHRLMTADLQAYPPCADPLRGFTVRAGDLP